MTEKPLEPSPTSTEQNERSLDASVRPRQIVSPYFNSDEAAEYLRYHGSNRLRSLYRFLKFYGIKTIRDRRRLLIRRRDLDLALEHRKRSA